MNYLDIIIIIFVLFGAVLGFKRGFTKELVQTIGFIIIIVLAYILKNPLSVLMYEYLPFFNFGILKNVAILNILIYEFLAFFICLAVLTLIFRFLLLATSIFEKILNATIILGIPSKIAGAIVGIIYHFIIVFIVLYLISLVFYDVSFINNSKFKDKILNNTPILSGFVDNSISVVKEVIELKEKYNDKTISESEFDYQAIKLFLDYNIITKESLNKLIETGKIDTFDNYGDLLKSYGGE